MIKITNCFKIEPELDKVTEEEWRECAQEGQVDLSYVKSHINLQDEGALELALRFADEARTSQLECQLSAVSAGSSKVINTLQTLAALGYSRTDRILWEEEFSPERTAIAIARYLEGQEKQDIILCGGQSGTGNNRAVPALIGELLGIPSLNNVKEFHPVDEETLKIRYRMDGVDFTEEVKMPVILAIGDVQKAYLRVPTLMQRMATASQMVGEFEIPVESQEGAVFSGIKFIDQSRETKVIDNCNPIEAAQHIYSILKQESVV